uniref:Uncharacterized protein n=1 Tax=Rhodopseudomonas palustris (strain BisA53) TaxID=316055 RepID=Q07KI3_RHOP5
MNPALAIASILAAVAAAVHIFMGGHAVATPLLDSAMEARPKLILYAVWHMASVALCLSAAALFVGGLRRHAEPSRYLVRFISLLWCCFGATFLAVIAIQPDGGWLFKLPQWTLLLPVGLLGFWGSTGSTRGLRRGATIPTNAQ